MKHVKIYEDVEPPVEGSTLQGPTLSENMLENDVRNIQSDIGWFKKYVLKMKHIKLLNEFISPRLPISKEELGLGIKLDDKLIINSELYYFWYFENNEIHVVSENGEEKIFNLDEINDTWEISKINDHEVVVESKKTK